MAVHGDDTPSTSSYETPEFGSDTMQGRFIHRDGGFSCLDTKLLHTRLQPEREEKLLSTPHPLSSMLTETDHGPQSSLMTVQSSPTGYITDFDKKSMHKLKPKILGRVMSEIHSNLPPKNLDSEDFLHVLVDRVIAEVANEITLHDEGAPLIYPALAQTNIHPRHAPKGRVGYAQDMYDDLPDPNTPRRPCACQARPPPRMEEVEKSQQSDITVSVVVSESSTDNITQQPSFECVEECPQRSCLNARSAILKLLTCPYFLLLLLILSLLFASMILGAFMGLAICKPHSCISHWHSSTIFPWCPLSKYLSHEPVSDIRGLF